jgi:hypothetical protein
MSEWQPIETAPKDGKRILLVINIDKIFVVIGGWDSSWTGQCWVYDTKRIPTDVMPTHWMPLPKPPEEIK